MERVGYSAELAVKGNSHHVSVAANNHTTNLSRLFKEKMKDPPTPPDQIGKGDHNLYKEEKGGGGKPHLPTLFRKI